jgi:thiol-disulfide isomerase/thioredoxin
MYDDFGDDGEQLFETYWEYERSNRRSTQDYYNNFALVTQLTETIWDKRLVGEELWCALACQRACTLAGCDGNNAADDDGTAVSRACSGAADLSPPRLSLVPSHRTTSLGLSWSPPSMSSHAEKPTHTRARRALMPQLLCGIFVVVAPVCPLLRGTAAPRFVTFYAPWCTHCKSMVSDWKGAATALEGEVGALRCGSYRCPSLQLDTIPALRAFPALVCHRGDVVNAV